MGKPYSHQYFSAGSGNSCGEMRCGKCGKAIDNVTQDWRAYCRDKGGDWRFVTHHRECCLDDPMWGKREAQDRQFKADFAAMEKDAAAFVAKWKRLGVVLSEIIERIEEPE